MFIAKMVKDFLDSTIKNSNPQQSSENAQPKTTRTGGSNYKANRKTVKTKKSYMKSDFNVEELAQTACKQDSKATSKPIIPTKVKSGSWKRSDKSITPFNTLTNKKHKNLRKKSPNWLKFANSKVKLHESNLVANSDSEPTSACRPGTLYSDVLFGAGCSNLVKIKNLTPRNSNNTTAAQKKLTKALFNCRGNNENETSDECEIEGKRNLFPALQKTNNKVVPSDFLTNASNACLDKQEMSTSTSVSPTKNDHYEEADVVILNDFKSLSLTENDISYGNYLEGHFQQLNGKVEPLAATSSSENTFLVSSISNIPKWNFMDAETGSDAFPKFLCQFDDENYLKAEKMAWLGLKLALGNNSLQNKAKY